MGPSFRKKYDFHNTHEPQNGGLCRAVTGDDSLLPVQPADVVRGDRGGLEEGRTKEVASDIVLARRTPFRHTHTRTCTGTRTCTRTRWCIHGLVGKVHGLVGAHTDLLMKCIVSCPITLLFPSCFIPIPFMRCPNSFDLAFIHVSLMSGSGCFTRSPISIIFPVASSI